MISVGSTSRQRVLIAVAATAAILSFGAGCEEIAEVETAAAGGPGSATDLQAAQDCDPEVLRKGRVLLSWTPAREVGSEQHVQVTIFREGFDTGDFFASKPLPPDQSSLLFEQVAGQALHRWRVMTVHDDTQTPSETARFTGPICVYDEAETEPTIPPIP